MTTKLAELIAIAIGIGLLALALLDLMRLSGRYCTDTLPQAKSLKSLLGSLWRPRSIAGAPPLEISLAARSRRGVNGERL